MRNNVIIKNALPFDRVQPRELIITPEGLKVGAAGFEAAEFLPLLLKPKNKMVDGQEIEFLLKKGVMETGSVITVDMSQPGKRLEWAETFIGGSWYYNKRVDCGLKYPVLRTVSGLGMDSSGSEGYEDAGSVLLTLTSYPSAQPLRGVYTWRFYGFNSLG